MVVSFFYELCAKDAGQVFMHAVHGGEKCHQPGRGLRPAFEFEKPCHPVRVSARMHAYANPINSKPWLHGVLARQRVCGCVWARAYEKGKHRAQPAVRGAYSRRAHLSSRIVSGGLHR